MVEEIEVYNIELNKQCLKNRSDDISKDLENQKLILTMDLPDSVNSIYGRNKWGGTYLKKSGKDYKKNMGKMIVNEVEKQSWVKPIGRFVYMDEIVYMSQKGRDPDNLKKLQQDAITESGVVWCDDSLALPRTNRLIIDKYNPRIEVELTVAPFMGIFQNEEHMQEFESKCKTCRRYSNNCSILRKAKENRVQKEINDFKCSEYNQTKP